MTNSKLVRSYISEVFSRHDLDLFRQTIYPFRKLVDAKAQGQERAVETRERAKFFDPLSRFPNGVFHCAKQRVALAGHQAILAIGIKSEANG